MGDLGEVDVWKEKVGELVIRRAWKNAEEFFGCAWRFADILDISLSRSMRDDIYPLNTYD